jgi:hypothetical protein
VPSLLFCCSIEVQTLPRLHILMLSVLIMTQIIIITIMNRYRSVGIAMDYGLDGRGSGVRFPVGARDFSFLHVVQPENVAHRASYPKGTGGSFFRGKAAGE